MDVPELVHRNVAQPPSAVFSASTCTRSEVPFSRVAAFFACCFSLVVFVAPAAASEVAWLIPTPVDNPTFGPNAAMDGFEFMPNEAIMVTALGWYDDTFSTPDGLATSHQVGIWDLTTELLLASAIVPSGLAAPKIGHFRFADLTTPLPLSAGKQYVIGGLGATIEDPNCLVPISSLTVAPQIAVGHWRNGGQVFSFPPAVIDGVPNVSLGPTFIFAPEPGMAAFIVLSMIAMVNRSISRVRR